MKLKYLIILILILLVGCSNNEITGENSSDANETSENTPEEQSQVGSDINLTEEELTAKYSKGSDLVAEVYSKGLYPDLKEDITIKFKANNEGENKVETEYDYTIEILKGEKVIYNYSNTSSEILESGDEITLKTIEYSFDSYGTYTAKLYLDNLNKAKELDESNNEDSVKIYVKEASTSSDDDDDDDEEIDEGENGECEDTDGGIDVDEVGTCTDGDSFKNGRTDFCAGKDDDMLGEMYCNSQGTCDIEMKECDGICKEGKCI